MAFQGRSRGGRQHPHHQRQEGSPDAEARPANLKYSKRLSVLMLERGRRRHRDRVHRPVLQLDKASAEKHIAAGAKKVLISPPRSIPPTTRRCSRLLWRQPQGDPTTAPGHHQQRQLHHQLPLALVAKVLHDKWVHQGRPDDHPTARRHRHAKDRGRPVLDNKDWRGGAAFWRTSSPAAPAPPRPWAW